MNVASLNSYALAAAELAYGLPAVDRAGENGRVPETGILKMDKASISPEAYGLLEKARQAVTSPLDGLHGAAVGDFVPAEPVYSGEFIDNIALKAYREDAKFSPGYPKLLKDLRSGDAKHFLDAFSKLTSVPVDELQARLASLDSDEMATISGSLGAFTDTNPAVYLEAMGKFQTQLSAGNGGETMA